MLVGNDEERLGTVLKWITQSREVARWYQHEELGFNYRMSNICAGIGRGQMEALSDHIQQKTRIFEKTRNSRW